MLFGNPLKFDLIAAAIILLLIALMIYNHRKAISPHATQSEGLGVKDLIEKVKAELIETEQNQIKSNQAALFEIKDFDLEINFVVSTRHTGTGKLEYNVVTVGGETEVSSERIQKINLHMTAIPPKAIEKPMSQSSVSAPTKPVVINPPPTQKEKNHEE